MKRALLFLLACLAFFALVWATDAEAQPLQYDPLLEARRAVIVALYVDTRRCMVSGSRAAMRNGALTPEAVKAFTVPTCSRQLRIELLGFGAFNAAQAERFIQELAQDALDDALYLSKPVL